MSEHFDMSKINILLVDDEQGILSSLKRLLRSEKYNIFTALGGADGLKIMQQNDIDLVISDMRMPNMSGAEFLEKVVEQWPQTVRILLTGFSDMSSTIVAVNKGKIHSYISKPWEDTQLKMNIRHALEQRLLVQEKERLEELTKRQNIELVELNKGLEAKVAERTKEIREKSLLLEEACADLSESYSQSVRVFSNVISLRENTNGKLCRSIADNAQEFAIKCLNMSEQQAKDIYFAGLLSNIGKLSFSDQLLRLPYAELNKQFLSIYQQHPVIAEETLMPLPHLSEVAKIIRYHRERFDGRGYPVQLKQNEIPILSQVLSIFVDFEELQSGLVMKEKMSFKNAVAFIESAADKRYSKELVSKFLGFAETLSSDGETDLEEVVEPYQLLPTMILSRDLVSTNGTLLLTKGTKLTEKIIGQIRMLEGKTNKIISLYVHKMSAEPCGV